MVKKAVSHIDKNGRKPIRPLERQRMRPWIWTQLIDGKTTGLSWYDKSKDIFKITWRHAARHGYDARSDADLFYKWARHTGRLALGDHKKWKANFRCALNSLPDVKELKKLGIGKGSDAFRVFQFLDERKPIKSERKDYVYYVEQTLPASTEIQDHQDSDSDGERLKDAGSDVSEMSDCTQSDSDSTAMDHTPDSEDEKDYSDLPAFDKICPSFATDSVSTTLPNHYSGCKFVSRLQSIGKDTDDSLSTTSSAMTDDDIVQLVLDAELSEEEYSSDIWNSPVAQEVITDDSGTTYIMLTQSARQPVVILPGTDTDHYDITSLVVQ